MEDFEVRAEIRHVWHSAQKVRLVVDYVRGMDATRALGVLKTMPQASAVAVRKVLSSAVANAENNFGMAAEDLYIAEISAEGADSPLAALWRPWPVQAHQEAVVAHHRRPEGTDRELRGEVHGSKSTSLWLQARIYL